MPIFGQGWNESCNYSSLDRDMGWFHARYSLDLASAAYGYQAPPLTRLAPIPGKEERNSGEFIDTWQIHKRRHEWRKS